MRHLVLGMRQMVSLGACAAGIASFLAPSAAHAGGQEAKMVMTVLEARLPRDRVGDIERVFTEGMVQVPPEIVTSFLVRDVDDPTLYRLTTVWRSREALEAMRASGVKPKGVQMFETVGAKPTLSIFEVVVARLP